MDGRLNLSKAVLFGARIASPAALGPAAAATLLDSIFHHAARRPRAPALTFLADGVRPAQALDYGQLATRVRSLAAHLSRAFPAGERALLLYGAGLEFPIALLACFHAGLVAVPAAVPDRPGTQALTRLRAIAASCGAGLVLCDQGVLEARGRWLTQAPELEQLPWQASDRLPASADDDVLAGDRQAPESVAFIQYTSGSTADPKGVVVTHANMLHNQQSLCRHFAQHEGSTVVSWLPAYHDMGLIGTILNPLFVGGQAYLMSTLSFIKRPHRWLQAISTYRATTTAAPDFAYAFCAQEITDQEKRGLDLRHWRVAISGGEMVRPKTLRDFASAFAGCGFEAQAFRPCYGLAESTLIVSAAPAGRAPGLVRFDRAELGRGRAVAVPDDTLDGSVEVVSCGRWLPDSEVSIVDPEARRRCPSGHTGEVWLRGGSVTAGYYGCGEQTRRTFAARLDDGRGGGSGSYCRTGDLGFIHGDELFIIGRLKDLIIFAGRNHHPEDIEPVVEGAHPAIARPAAAFSVERAGEEQVVVVAEMRRGALVAPTLLSEVQEAIRRAVHREHSLHVAEVVFVPQGTIPRTSSGKVRRSRCRQLLEQGALARLSERTT